ncbi:hypothetical protein V494_05441 [Pseudogymnoascus sp. VKM F-4513 (FW-928)]|nr:hypothetical protein V494_05441 [Pseudogymnoascus sp. VKM F-4513 (FW-928)]
MTIHSLRAWFRRRSETEEPTQQLHTDDEQLPSYSESQNQEQSYQYTDQSPSNAEKSKADQNANTEKGKIDQSAEEYNLATEAIKTKDQKWCTFALLLQVDVETDVSLQKLRKTDLVEILDIARDRASDPFYEPLRFEILLNTAAVKPFKGFSQTLVTLLRRVRPNSVYIKKSTVQDKEVLLRIARVTPYIRMAKSELMQLPNWDLVDLLREAQREHNEQHIRPHTKLGTGLKERKNYFEKDLSPRNSEKSKDDQKSGAENGVSSQTNFEAKAKEERTKAEEQKKLEAKAEEERRRIYIRIFDDLPSQLNESLDKLRKSDLVEILDIAREKAVKASPELNFALELDITRGESVETAPYTKEQDMPSEKLSKLDLVELLRVARVTPFYRLPKSELMRVPNSDLVDLLREARSKYMKRYSEPKKIWDSRYEQGDKSHQEPEAKQQKDNQVCRPEDTPLGLPSRTELESKGLEGTSDEKQLQISNWLDRVEEQPATMKADLVKEKGVGCGNVAAENDTGTGSPAESTNSARSSRETAAIKLIELYGLTGMLKTDCDQNKTFEDRDFDNLETVIIWIQRDLDAMLSRARENLIRSKSP